MHSSTVVIHQILAENSNAHIKQSVSKCSLVGFLVPFSSRTYSACPVSSTTNFCYLQGQDKPTTQVFPQQSQTTIDRWYDIRESQWWLVKACQRKYCGMTMRPKPNLVTFYSQLIIHSFVHIIIVGQHEIIIWIRRWALCQYKGAIIVVKLDCWETNVQLRSKSCIHSP